MLVPTLRKPFWNVPWRRRLPARLSAPPSVQHLGSCVIWMTVCELIDFGHCMGLGMQVTLALTWRAQATKEPLSDVGLHALKGSPNRSTQSGGAQYGAQGMIKRPYCVSQSLMGESSGCRAVDCVYCVGAVGCNRLK